MSPARHDRVAAATVIVIVAVGAWLRFDGLGEPSYWLDEVLGQLVARQSNTFAWWRWFTGVHPQHGPVYYALQRLALAFGDDEWTGRLFAALAGVGAIPAIWMAGRRAAGAAAATAAAVLLAVSPLHVYYSREARPYGLVVLLSTALLLAILYRSLRFAVPVLVALLYTSVSAAPVVAAGLCAALLASLVESDERRRALRRIALAAVVTLCAFSILYRSAEGDAASVFPGLTWTFFDGIVRGLSVTATGAQDGGRTAYAVFALALAGGVALARANRRAAVVVLSMAVVPTLVSIAALRLQNHFFGIRYVVASLPAYALLAGAGAAAITRLLFKGTSGVLPVLRAIATVTIVVVIAVETWPAARAEPFRKLDWRGIAAVLHSAAHPGDLVLCAEPWSGIVLRYYLERLPKKVVLIQTSEVEWAQELVRRFPAVWLVAGGFNPQSSVRAWMCNHPVVMTSALEFLRVHYASRSGRGFLQERGGPAEWRAAAAAFGGEAFTLQMTEAEAPLFAEGWAGPERGGGLSFRWAVGTRAALAIPPLPPRDRVLRMALTPLDDPSLPRQTMTVEMNGVVLASLELPPGSSEQNVRVPAAAWRNGPNALVFTFGRARAPASFDPHNPDPRKLAAAFDRISLGAPGAETRAGVAELTPRLASGALLDEKSLWRGTRTNLPASRLRRREVVMLLGRMGIDPETVWPRLERGELHLDDLAEAVSSGTDCIDDESFIRFAWRVLLDREPGEAELRSLLGIPRERVAGRIAKSQEFRANVLIR